MARESSVQRCRVWYARLLRLYPTQFRERFGEGMEQTFADSCRRRRTADAGLFGFVIWVFAETFTAIIREHVPRLRRHAMRDDSIRLLKTVKYSAIAVGVLMVAGILTLMVLARGKGADGDIAGVVAPALLATFVSGAVAVVAAVRQKRAQRRAVHP